MYTRVTVKKKNEEKTYMVKIDGYLPDVEVYLREYNDKVEADLYLVNGTREYLGRVWIREKEDGIEMYNGKMKLKIKKLEKLGKYTSN